jgi:hypothetical protein
MSARRQGQDEFVQLGLAALDWWGKLAGRDPTSSRLLIWLIRNMDKTAAVCFSHGVAAAELGLCTKTIQRSLKRLDAQNFIRTVKINGQANVYLINALVAWRASRSGIRTAKFSATIIASAADQNSQIERPLQSVPTPPGPMNVQKREHGRPS